MWKPTRRNFLRAGAALAAAGAGLKTLAALAQAPLGQRPTRDAAVQVINPLGRVPLSFFIDDSSCLVNLGHFCMPQFAEAWPTRDIYKKPWKTWPREIPDAFVREFAEFCAEHGVKGKYSVVPFPACVGRLDRELPGWSRQELLASLKLVRDVMLPNWDVHPEMITHTRVIDLATGHPLPEISSATMENSYPQGKKSVDELAAYIAYSLRILKNCDLPCEGITTPGGFGNAVKSELSLAVGQAVREVYGAELPHYFKYVSGGKESTQPKAEHVEGLDTDSPQAVISLPAGTGDWFGNWDGDAAPEGHRYANADATGGRMVELIERGEPAVMLCHWPGLYNQGAKTGLEQFKQVVLALEGRYRDRTMWMKIGELARYWAARELTRIERDAGRTTFTAPFAAPGFTVRLPATGQAPPQLRFEPAAAGRAPASEPRPAGSGAASEPRPSGSGPADTASPVALAEAKEPRDLKPGTYLRQADSVTVCFDLPKGRTVLSA
ncbi:MAG: hypothetical protein FJ288_13280 [Planctomycetes bacterium]|nr:hypothetical protein [Planctomycetota bacterium]